MKSTKIMALGIALLVVLSGCGGFNSRKKFFKGKVVTEAPEDETVISYNATEVAENEELQEVVRRTVKFYKNGSEKSRTRTIAASPKAVEQFRELPTAYIEYRNETVKVTVLTQS